MIEKLKNIPTDMNGKPSAVWLKINELIDAVNKLQKDYDNVCIWVGEQKLKTPAENVAENGKCAKNAQDPYAELCGALQIKGHPNYFVNNRGEDNITKEEDWK